MYKRIYVEIGNICNLKCSFCPPLKRPKRQMTPKEFESVCKKIKPYTNTVLLHVMGEPLLHPDLDEILFIAGNHGLKVSITTNGTLLKRVGDILLKHSEFIHRISISLHCMEGNDKDSLALKNYLESCFDFSKKSAKKGIYTVFRLWNNDSTEGVGQNSRNSLILKALREEFQNDWAKRWSGYRIEENIFLEYAGIFIWPSQSNASSSENGFCYGGSDHLSVLADGTVAACCLDSEGEIKLGNIFEEDMETIINSKALTELCEGFKKGKYTHSLCKKCTYARRFKK